MCNRARLKSGPETLFTLFNASWAQNIVRPNRDLVEIYLKSKADGGVLRATDPAPW